MDSLFTTFILAALCMIGDRAQLLGAGLATRFADRRMLIIGIGFAAFINCVVSAGFGRLLADWISQDALRLFFALSLLFAGGAMLLPARPVDLMQDWKAGALPTAFLGLFSIMLGDKAQFIVLSNSARTQDALLTGLGGWLGIMAALVPAAMLGARMADLRWLGPVRKGAGAVLLILGLILVLAAYGLWG